MDSCPDTDIDPISPRFRTRKSLKRLGPSIFHPAIIRREIKHYSTNMNKATEELILIS